MNSCKYRRSCKARSRKSCANCVRPVMDYSDEELYLITQKSVAESDVISGDDANIKLRTDLIDFLRLMNELLHNLFL